MNRIHATPETTQFKSKKSWRLLLFDQATLAICQKAEQGLPTAQLALAQIYSARRSGSKDLVSAYMWYLIVNEQIARARNHVNKTMTMEQLLEAEQRAVEWMRTTKQLPLGSIEDNPDREPKLATGASTA